MAQQRNFGPQEQKDLNKFLKFMSLKAVQLIVQSRLGNKIHTKSKPNAMGQDWFNLAIDDIPEVMKETKKAMDNQLPSKDSPMCVEISLKTNEGDAMTLETWCLGLNDRVDSNAKVTYTVYNKMGILLKSLTSVSRVTPAYQLARKQGPDFILCYRVYFGDARVQELGDGFQSLRVGSIGTPIGSISLSTAYRTKLTLPERSTVTVMSDYFQCGSKEGDPCTEDSTLPCTSACGTVNPPMDTRHRIVNEIASAAATEVTRSPSSFSVSPPRSSQTKRTPSAAKKSCMPRTTTLPNKESVRPSTLPQPVEHSSSRTKGAFASSPSTPELPDLPALSSTPPFAALLSNHAQRKPHQSGCPDTAGQSSPDRRLQSTKENTSGKPERKSRDISSLYPAPSCLVADEDFVMVELKPAFASHSGASGDLGSFYRECQTAPPLELFLDSDAQVDRIMGNLDGELNSFHENGVMFDELLADLQQGQIY